MGDPRKQRRKYSRPTHLWRAERIAEESELCKKYGLKNKREVWRAKSKVKRFRQQARTLLGLPESEETKKEAKELLDKLNKLGIVKAISLENVLTLTIEDILERRLQTLVYKKGIANSIKQARQFITHRHVKAGGKIIAVPSYAVPKIKEDTIQLAKEMKVKGSA